MEILHYLARGTGPQIGQCKCGLLRPSLAFLPVYVNTRTPLSRLPIPFTPPSLYVCLPLVSLTRSYIDQLLRVLSWQSRSELESYLDHAEGLRATPVAPLASATFDLFECVAIHIYLSPLSLGHDFTHPILEDRLAQPTPPGHSLPDPPACVDFIAMPGIKLTGSALS